MQENKEPLSQDELQQRINHLDRSITQTLEAFVMLSLDTYETHRFSLAARLKQRRTKKYLDAAKASMTNYLFSLRRIHTEYLIHKNSHNETTTDQIEK